MEKNSPFRLKEINNYRKLKTENNRINLEKSNRKLNYNIKNIWDNDTINMRDSKNSLLSNNINKNVSIMNNYFNNQKIRTLNNDNSENNINLKKNIKRSIFEDEYFIEKFKKNKFQNSLNKSNDKKKNRELKHIIHTLNFGDFLNKIQNQNNNKARMEKTSILNLPKVIIKNMPHNPYIEEKKFFIKLKNCFENSGKRINKETVIDYFKNQNKLINFPINNFKSLQKNSKNNSFTENNEMSIKKHEYGQQVLTNINESNNSFDKKIKIINNKYNNSSIDKESKQRKIVLPNIKKEEQFNSIEKNDKIYQKTFNYNSNPNDDKTINNTENNIKKFIILKNDNLKNIINNNSDRIHSNLSNKDILKSQSHFSSPKSNKENILKKNILETNSKLKGIINEIPPLNYYSKDFYYYNIFPYNCGWLIKKCFNHRLKWKECHSNNTNLFDFKWKDVASMKDFIDLSSSRKQIINHFEYHSCLSNKYNMFYNFAKFCESNGIDVFKYVPFTIGFDCLNFDELNIYQENFKEIFNNINNYVFENESINNQLFDRKKIPYKQLFPLCNPKIGNKFYCEIPKSHYAGKNLWIVKAPNLNRGRCIKIFDNYNEIIKFLNEMRKGNVNQYDNIKEKGCKEKIINDGNENVKNIENEKEIKDKKTKKGNNNKDINNGSNNKDNNEKGKNKEIKEKGDYQSDIIIMQKYIEKPFLYNGRKCDIRIWVLITHKMDVYIFKEGHLKASSVNYSVNNNNSFIHLTNYSLQKYNKNFSKYETGNEISFNIFQEYLNNLGEKSFNFRELIIPKFKKIIELTTKSSKNLINKKNKNYCFELFGYDFMMDEDKNVYLIEINTNPGLEISSEIIEILVPRMIDDTLRITVDEIFETEYSKEWTDEDGNYKSNFHVEGYDDKENMWEYVCNMNKSNDKYKFEEYYGFGYQKGYNKKKNKKSKGQN